MENSTKQKLKLIREFTEYENRSLDFNQQTLSSATARVLEGQSIIYQIIRNYKARVLESIIPDDSIQASPLFQDVINAYDNWLQGNEDKEYLVKSFDTLLSYTFNPDFQIKDDIMRSVLKMFYNRFEFLINRDCSSKYTEEEQMFIGSFRTFFKVDMVSPQIIEPACRFFEAFNKYRSVFTPLDKEHLSVIDQVEIVSIWKENLRRKQNMKLERERVN